MGFYNDVILPRICDLAMRNEQLRSYRERVIGAAEGRAGDRNRGWVGPEFAALSAAGKRGLGAGAFSEVDRDDPQGRDPAMPVNFIEASAEAIPLDDHSIDTVVTTWTLCSIPDAAMALTEMRRVLRPTGKLGRDRNWQRGN